MFELGEKGPQPLLGNIHGHPMYGRTYLLGAHIFYLESNYFAVNKRTALCLAFCSVVSRMYHIDFDHVARMFGTILRLFSASYIFFLLTQINFRVLTSVVTEEIVFVFTAFSASRIKKK